MFESNQKTPITRHQSIVDKMNALPFDFGDDAV